MPLGGAGRSWFVAGAVVAAAAAFDARLAHLYIATDVGGGGGATWKVTPN
jgi:hypothetical protein